MWLVWVLRKKTARGFLSEIIREVSGMGVLFLVVAMKGRLHKLGH